MIEWIKLEHLTIEKPEVLNLADLLGIDKDTVIGKLCRLWIWADKYTQDGTIQFQSGVAASRQIDEISRHKGFATALQHVQWLVISVDGKTIFSNYAKHNGETAKKRCQTNRRVAKHRKK